MTTDPTPEQAARDALASLPFAWLTIHECPVCGEASYSPACDRCRAARKLAAAPSLLISLTILTLTP